MNGWTLNNGKLRTEILLNLQFDITCICETHLKNKDTLEHPDYNWYGYNRSLTHVKATKGSGGVGIFVSCTLENMYTIHVIDKNIDDVLGIQFMNKFTDRKIAVFVCYLPPEYSTWGRDCDSFLLI